MAISSRIALMCVLSVAVLSGCASRFTDVREGILAHKSEPRSLELINGTYKAEPPDVIEISVRDNRDLNTQVTVRPDGNITFPLLGDVYVAGMTPEEISKMLDEQLSAYIRDVQTTVTVTGFNSKKVYVFGEVYKQGPQPFTGDMTLVESVANAGGITLRSAPGSVRLVRGDIEAPKVFKINLKDITRRGQQFSDLQLKDGDIVYVPPNGFAKVGYALDNVLFPFRGLLGVAYSAAGAHSLATE